MWRKVLQIFNIKKFFFDLCKGFHSYPAASSNPTFASKFLIFYILFFIKVSVFCQNLQMPQNPQMPSMPQMPTISSEGSFYTPNFPASTKNQAKSAENNSEFQNQDETVIKSQTLNSPVSALLDGNTKSVLTASDISALYDLGLFGNISSVNKNSFYTNNYDLENFSSDYNARTSNSLLLQILAELEQMKNNQKNTTVAQKQEFSDVQADAKIFKKREPSVLRFKINGYDIKNSLTESFFSDAEPDGTFLFTADRKYFANSKTYKETFYFLFSAKKSNGSTVFYNVQPRIIQETKNENSYVYKFVNKNDITAEKTGNLVVLHYSDEDLEADILLDIDKR